MISRSDSRNSSLLGAEQVQHHRGVDARVLGDRPQRRLLVALPGETCLRRRQDGVPGHRLALTATPAPRRSSLVTPYIDATISIAVENSPGVTLRHALIQRANEKGHGHGHDKLARHTHHTTPVARTTSGAPRRRHHRRDHRRTGDPGDRVRAACGALRTARRADRRCRPAGRQWSDRAMIEQNTPGAFAVTYYPERGRAGGRDQEPRRLRRHRASVGARADRPRCSSPRAAVRRSRSCSLSSATSMSHRTGIPLRTADLAPPTARDPRGAGLAASALPITLAGIVPAIALVLALRREVWTRFAAALVLRTRRGRHDRRPASVCSRLGRTQLLGSGGRADPGRGGGRAGDPRPGLAVRQGRPRGRRRCWHCSWATRCRV